MKQRNDEMDAGASVAIGMPIQEAPSGKSAHRLGMVSNPRRRNLLSCLTGVSLAYVAGTWPRTASAHGIGVVKPPVPVPAGIQVRGTNGLKVRLKDVLADKITAMQLVFTECSQTCLLQGAMFAEVQQRMPQQGFQLLSISIDPKDGPKRLREWLARFGAGSGWKAYTPMVGGLSLLRSAIDKPGRSRSSHAQNVLFFDGGGRLVWRSEDLPTSDMILQAFASLGG
jgi:protein SCO1/2